MGDRYGTRNTIRPQAVSILQNIFNQVSRIVQQLIAQLPWGHTILIFTKAKNIEAALFYIQKTVKYSSPNFGIFALHHAQIPSHHILTQRRTI
jgi:hypothetical protein